MNIDDTSCCYADDDDDDIFGFKQETHGSPTAREGRTHHDDSTPIIYIQKMKSKTPNRHE